MSIRSIVTDAPGDAVAGARVAGAYGQNIVYVHGVGSTAAIWDRQLIAFEERSRGAAIELRGNGVPKPEPDPSAITRRGFADDVLAVMDALEMPTATLIGCSLGGVVAMELATFAAHRFEAFVIVGSFACYPNAQRTVSEISEAVRAAGSMRAFAVQRAAKLGLPPERYDETIEQMAVKSIPSYLAATQATWTGDYRATLPRVSVPTLVLCGERDTVAPLALSREIAEGIPGAELEVVEGAGHVSNADNPEGFHRHLASFEPLRALK